MSRIQAPPPHVVSRIGAARVVPGAASIALRPTLAESGTSLAAALTSSKASSSAAQTSSTPQNTIHGVVSSRTCPRSIGVWQTHGPNGMEILHQYFGLRTENPENCLIRASQ
ncbi:hypothetical protein EVG20_g9249 [Dentipellis fragilis]|uniref:Uncharacterized protein n=1 Tax=Dentipellis fragilis TaxID=205917 RepID=A0A4Y9XZX6_9AGAM|nr:hypothetical protein EVG20_g9249 [Dentipellis fragilis]